MYIVVLWQLFKLQILEMSRVISHSLVKIQICPESFAIKL